MSDGRQRLALLEAFARTLRSREVLRHLPWAIGIITSVVVAAVSFTGLTEEVDYAVWDAMQRFNAGRSAPDPRITLIAIGQRGIKEMANNRVFFPWPRDVWARLIEIADSAGSLGIVFDISFESPGISGIDSDGGSADMAFAAALSPDFPVVIAASIAEEGESVASLPAESRWTDGPLPRYFAEENRLLLPYQAFRHAYIGLANTPPEADGVIRRAPLLFDVDGISIPSLSLAIIHAAGLASISQVPNDDDWGIWLKFYGEGGPHGKFPYISAADLIMGRIEREALTGKVLIVGGFAAGLLDYKPTALASVSRPFPGFEIHATILSHLLKGDGLAVLSPWLTFAIAVSVGGAAIAMARWKSSVILQITSLIAVAGVIHLISILGFLNGLLIGVGAPISAAFCGVGATIVADLNYEGKRRRRLYELFTRYKDSKVVEELINNREDSSVTGKLQEVTIVFCDIVGFSAQSEGMRSDDIVEMINAYFYEIVESYKEHDGLIDKYIGDEVMALFGAPTNHPDSALQAARAILDAERRTADLTVKRNLDKKPTVSLRTGVHTDFVTIGSIGHPKQRDFTVIGSGVNIASRLQSATRKLYSMNLASSDFIEKLPVEIPRRLVRRVKLKGITKPLCVYELMPIETIPSQLDRWEDIWSLWFLNRRREAVSELESYYRENQTDRTAEKLLESLKPLINKQGVNDDIEEFDAK